jgi:NAD(P)-dependent dehydrogenase (short-subunit alcohol dehydrogenase family)
MLNKYSSMVNNAGIAPDGAKGMPIWEFDEDIFDLALKVNVKGTLIGTKFASRQMIKQEPHKSGQRGWIVNLGSVYGLVGEATVGSYISLNNSRPPE